MVWLYGTIDYLGEFAHVDLRHYRAMAQAAPGLSDTPSPFAYRWLGPYAVGLLPVPDPLGFRLLTTSALVLLPVAFFGFLRRLGLGASVAAFTAALLPFNPYVFGFPAFNPFQIGDALALVLIVLAFSALVDRRWLLYALALAVGVLAREPVLLVLPAGFVFLWERGTLRSDGLRCLVASLPALVVFLLLRVLLPADGPGLLVLLVDHAVKASDPVTWYRLLVNAWAPLSFIPLVFFRTTRVFVRRHLYLVAFAVLVLASALFGGDQERLVAPAFITVYALVGYVLQRHMWTRLARIVLVLAAVVTSLHHLTARFPLPSRTWTVVLSLAALAAVTAVALAVRRGRNAAVET